MSLQSIHTTQLAVSLLPLLYYATMKDSSEKSSICESEIRSLKSKGDISIEKFINDEDSIERIEYISLDVLSVVSLNEDYFKSKSPSLQSKIDDVVNVKEVKETTIKVQEKIEVKSKSTISRGSHYIYICLFIFVACITMLAYQITRTPHDSKVNLSKKMKSSNETLFDFDCYAFKGDGFCDDEANNELCNYDEGDCCDPHFDRSLCIECFCYIEYFPNKDYLKYSVVGLLNGPRGGLSHARHGDGNCDLEFNIYEQFFDAGDCCLANRTIYYEGLEYGSTGMAIPVYSDPPRPCAENECECIPNNLVCNETQIGDGKCQDYNNGPLCDYDLGDCCLRWTADPDVDECANCFCHLGQTFFFTEEFREEIFGPK